jgi:hypothetical protein
MTENKMNYYKAYAFFSFQAALALITLSIFLIISPARIDFNAIPTTYHYLDSVDLKHYKDHLSISFSIISIYLLSNFMMWIGWANFINPFNSVLAKTLLVIGLLATLSDFSEYCLRGIIISAIESNSHILLNSFAQWQFIRKISIWTIHLNVLLVTIGTLNSPYAKVCIFFSVIGLILIPVLNIFNFGKFWYIWLISWHFASSFIFIKISKT